MNMKVIATVFYCLAMSVISILFLGIYLLGDLTSNFYWGLLVGLVLSFFSWIYLAQTWNPRTLSSTKIDPKREKKAVWIIIIIIGVSYVLLKEFSDSGWQLLAGAGYSWLLLSLGSVVILAWLYGSE